ncbi:MAG: ABC transporter ATP-binding protein [Candidatus Heimdallarchaeota archaeon]|nr:ABC transporter ATP-binding protein [Candidatus Heimdallarchaeota archaeon]
MIIEFSDVSMTFSNQKRVEPVLNSLSTKIKSNEFVIILGPSGSGKSTLLNLISGNLKPSKGIIKINEEKKHSIGYIYQDFYLFENLNILENIIFGLNDEKIDNSIEYVNELSKVFKIEDKLSFQPSQLSGGEKQRVCIVRSLISNPMILLGDEITGNLNSELALEIIEYLIKIKQINQGMIIILVTHNRNLVRKGMRVIELQNGNIINDYTKK